MDGLPERDITALLRDWSGGDREALERLMPLVYGELRTAGAALLPEPERPDHTLQPTALVHEAYLRLQGQRSVGVANRAHFFGIAARIMRRILVDHARRRRAAKRDAAALRLDDGDAGGGTTARPSCIALDSR